MRVSTTPLYLELEIPRKLSKWDVLEEVGDIPLHPCCSEKQSFRKKVIAEVLYFKLNEFCISLPCRIRLAKVEDSPNNWYLGFIFLVGTFLVRVEAI